MLATLALAGATRLATAAAFLVVARRFHARPVSPANRGPRDAAYFPPASIRHWLDARAPAA